MRKSFAIAVVLSALCGLPAHGQNPFSRLFPFTSGGGEAGENCEARPEPAACTTRPADPTCAEKGPCGRPPCGPPCVPEKKEQEEREKAPGQQTGPNAGVGGMFVAPPRSGTAAGATRSLGVNGPALVFPELRIGLPSLELPSLTRYRRGERMRLDAAEAAYETGPALAYGPYGMMAGGLAGGLAGTSATGPELAPQRPEKAPDDREKDRGSKPEKAGCSDRAGGEVERRCDQKLMQLEVQERRIETKLEELDQCLSRLEQTRLALEKNVLPAQHQRLTYTEGLAGRSANVPVRLPATFRAFPVQQSDYVLDEPRRVPADAGTAGEAKRLPATAQQPAGVSR